MNNSDHSRLKNSLKNQYQILEKIAEGGCGCVFKAKQLSTLQLVAIKTFKKFSCHKERLAMEIKQQFEREVEICARVNHPNIVQLIDRGFLSDFEFYVVFEYLHGETLKNYILRNGSLAFDNMANLMGQVLQALVYAHKSGIVHGDLKPENIMIMQYGENFHVKVLDFGKGHFVSDIKNQNGEVINTNCSFVSPRYNAPEQLRGKSPGCYSDLYSWGLIVLECITGKAAIGGYSERVIYNEQLSSEDLLVPKIVKEHDLGDLLQKVLRKKWHERCNDSMKLLKEFSRLHYTDLPFCLTPNDSNFKMNKDHTIFFRP
ncbi:protein kinase [Marinifilum sp. D714]|uniref:serine/threonine protein kinase n=1 Tax=Marinifilum sp. D714 TaxID=2937523 RepID=UPI0027BF27D2|nr:protein kinase [Marinifilum sp. D714]MDQ2179997.1 protein kinase [Marinifilum sp. D714]